MLWIRRILLMGGVLFIALLVVVMVLENRQVTHFELFGLLTPSCPLFSMLPWCSSWVVSLAYWPVHHF